MSLPPHGSLRAKDSPDDRGGFCRGIEVPARCLRCRSQRCQPCSRNQETPLLVVLGCSGVLGVRAPRAMISKTSVQTLAKAIALSLLVFGCAPEIGDACTTSNDCSANGDRLCDTTQRGGYCTIFNCDPTSCPDDEAICVQFGAVLSTVGMCPNPQHPSPQSRTFCMKSCSNNGDCRGGYRCMDLGKDNPWGAVVVEKDPSTTKVCIQPQRATPIDDTMYGDPDRDDAVCEPVSRSAGGASGWGGQGGERSSPGD